MGSHIEYDVLQRSRKRPEGSCERHISKTKDSPAGTVGSRILCKMARNMKREYEGKSEATTSYLRKSVTKNLDRVKFDYYISLRNFTEEEKFEIF